MTGVPFSHRVRVYWEDTDGGGVVYHANWLRFFERARTEWLRAGGVGQRALHEDAGALFVVTDLAIRYRRPARLDDELDVRVELRESGRASLRLAQSAWRAGELLAEGDVRIGCVGAGTFRPQRIPTSVLDALAGPTSMR
jgi:acyl-CoA thioester hydrolase